MAFMFTDCTSLISLNLSNFITSSSQNFNQLFSGCINLEYIDISNFDISQANTIFYLFYDCRNLKYVNLNNLIEGEPEFIFNILNGVPENFTYCVNNEQNIPLFLAEIKNKNCTINDCTNDWYLKTKKIISKKEICVYNCSLDDQYKYEYKNICYDICPEGTILSEEKNKCLIKCPESEPFEKNEECFDECRAQEYFDKECIINNKNINSKETMINIIINDIINRLMDSSLIDILNENKKDLIIKDNDEVYKISSIYNQKNNEDTNDEIKIDFENCENILKEKNIINNDQTLILFEMDYSIDGFYIPIIEYEIFHPETKQKIDLSLCSETTINISIPVNIEENDLYKHNPYSEYYKNKDYQVYQIIMMKIY